MVFHLQTPRFTFVEGGDVTQPGGPKLMDFATHGQTPDYRAAFLRREDHAVAGLFYTVEFSADLAEWETGSETPTRLTNPGSPDGLVAVSVPFPSTVPVKTCPLRFFRVRVGMQ